MIVSRGRRGVTLLEILSASMLLGLLVTLLLSLFNQGEIAWTIGEAAMAETGRQELSLVRAAQEGADAVFVKGPTPAAVRLLSAWGANGDIRTSRPFVRIEADLPEVGRAVRPIALASSACLSAERVEVVVTSAGPDGQWGTEDDLTTAPLEDVE